MIIKEKQIEYILNQINKRLSYSVEKYKPYRINNSLVSNIGHYYLQKAYGKLINKREKITNPKKLKKIDDLLSQLKSRMKSS